MTFMTYLAPQTPPQLRTKALLLFVWVSLLVVTPATASTTLHLLTWRASDVQLWRYIADHEMIPDVRVTATLIPIEAYDAVRRGEFDTLEIDVQPDMVQTQAALGWLNTLSNLNLLLPLPNLSLEAVLPSGLSTVMGADGQVFGIPFGMQMATVIYNKAVFDASGLKVPTSSDSWESLLKQADNAGVIPLFVAGNAGWWVSQMFHETLFAGRVSSSLATGLVAGTACFNDPLVVQALSDVVSWKRYMNDKPALASYQDMQSAFALGDAAMIIDGQWSTNPASPLFQLSPQLSVGTFPLPGPNGAVASFATGGYVGLNRTASPDAVAQVMNFIASEAFAQLSMALTGDIPAFSGKLVINDPRLAEIADQIVGNGYPVHMVAAPQLGHATLSLDSLLATGYRQLLAGQVTPEEMAAAVQLGLNTTGYAGAVLCDI